MMYDQHMGISVNEFPSPWNASMLAAARFGTHTGMVPVSCRPVLCLGEHMLRPPAHARDRFHIPGHAELYP